jgi:two-component system, OmpR family, sensor kinase
MSLRYRLLLVLLSAIAATTVIATGATYYWARHEIDELFDYHLRQQALALRDKANMLGTVVVPEPDPEQDFVIQAWDWRGQRVYLSHRDIQLPRSTTLGYADINAAGVNWRVYAVTLGAHLIQIAQPMRLRRQLATQAALKILYPLLAVLPALALLVWWLVGRVLAPLGELARTIGAREAAQLLPLATQDLPSEARLMVEALNDLIARLQQVVARQREFMADAAHELRTPLTALQLQTQLLARAQSPTAQAEAIEELKAGVQRSTHLVARLLDYARLDAAPNESSWSVVDLSELALGCVQELAPRAAEMGLTLNSAIAPTLQLEGNAVGLRSLLSNLLDNALRYTPAPGHVALDLRSEGDAIVIEVTDTGPGIAPVDRARIFDRFYRIPGAAASGSGLGLAIVKRVVEAHGGEVAVGAGPGGRGARFTVRLLRRRGQHGSGPNIHVAQNGKSLGSDTRPTPET